MTVKDSKRLQKDKRRWMKWCIDGLLLLFICVALFVGCYHSSSELTPWSITEVENDSLEPAAGKYFSRNANFEVNKDSVDIENLPLKDAYITLYRGEHVVVADFIINPIDTVDSVWVKVALSHDVQGWLPERVLLQSFIPTDSVSQLIHQFSHIRIFYLLCVFTLFNLLLLYYLKRRNRLHLFFLKQANSIYPILFCVVAACSAVLYESIQLFAPDTWQFFYFNPTLSPFKVPLLLGFFIGSLWLLLILLIASIDDLFRQVDTLTAFFHLASMLACAIYSYLFFVFTTSYYIGYPLLIVFGILAISYLHKKESYRYICGKCGCKMKRKGKCEHCGTLNQ